MVVTYHYNCLLIITISPVMCARDAEEKIIRKEIGQQTVVKERLASSRRFDKLKKKNISRA